MVRKKLFSLCAVMMMMALCLSSCRKSQEEYESAIPAEATLVVSVDLKELAIKSGMDKNEEAKQKLEEVLKDRINSQVGAQLVRLMKNPSESGLSVQDKVYLFAMKADGALSLVAKVTDQEKVKETFEAWAKEHVCSRPEKVKGYYQVVLGGETLCAFSENTLLLTSKDGSIEAVEKNIETWMTQKASQSILSNDGFTRLNEKKGDIGFFITMEAVPDMYTSPLKMTLPQGMELKDMKVLGALNFENGKIAITIENFSNQKQMEEWNRQVAEVYGKSASGFMKYYPLSTPLYLGVNINGSKLLKISDDFTSQLKEYSKQFQWDFVSMLSSVDGDVAFGLTGFGESLPSFLVCAAVKDETILNELSNKIGGRKMGKKQYAKTMYGMNVLYGMEGKTLYVVAGNKSFGGLAEIKPSLEESPWSAVAKGSYGYFGVNVPAMLSFPLLSSLDTYEEQAGTMQGILSQIESVECYAASTKEGNIDIVMKNKKENALRVWVNFAREPGAAF